MKRFKIAQIIATVATVLSVIGLILLMNDNDISTYFLGFGGIIGLVSYIFGGLGTAIGSALSIGKYGFLIGRFPFNIVSGLITIMFAGVALVFLPIFPVIKAYNTYLRNHPIVFG